MLEAYSVAVRLKLVDSVSSGLMGMAAQFAAFNRHVSTSQTNLKALEGQLQRIKLMGVLGGVAIGAGAFGLMALKAPLEEAKRFQTEVARFSALGLGDQVTNQAIQFAKGMDVMGQSARDNLKLLREATSIMGDFGHAREAAPLLSKMKFGLESVMGDGSGSKFEGMFQAAIKTTELRGALVNRATGQIDIGKFSNALNMMTQAYVASGGLVKPQDYLAAIKTGGVSTKLMSDEAFYFGLGHFMQESGGSRTGTASMSMFQNWAMGRTSKQIAQNMASIGLIQSGAIQNKLGNMASFDIHSLKNYQDFIDNPFRYVNNTVVPLLQKQGFKGDALNFKLASLLGIRTASNLADQYVRDEKIADLYITRAHKASNIDQLYKLGGGTAAGKELNLHAKYMDLLREVGTAALPIFTKAVVGLTTVLKAGISFARAWPTLTKGLVIAFMGLSALMVAGGAATLIVAGFRALGLALAVSKGIGLGSQLLSVAGGLSSVATMAARFLGAAGLVAAAGGVGYMVGDAINKAGPKGDLGGSLAGKLYEFMNPYNPNKTVFHVHNKVDKHGITTMVTEGQAKASHRPQTGLTTFDGRMSVAPAGGF